jgi:hypothetical protein
MTALASRSGAAGVLPRSGLQFSDYCYLLAVAVAALVAIDPVGSASTEARGLSDNPVLKHLALLIAVPAVLLAVIGRKLRRGRRSKGTFGALSGAAWPLLMLAALIIGGSAHARAVGGIQSTFLIVGLYMFAGIALAATMVQQSDAPEALVRNYFRILVVAAIVVGLYMVVRQGYHELSYLVIPMAALCFLAGRWPVTRWAGLLFFLSMAWFSNKYTSFLIALLSVGYIWLAVTFAQMQTRPLLHRVTVVYWVCILGCVGVAIIALLALNAKSDLPTGNPEYRLHTYALAWERFTQSPVWGTLFSAEAVEKFTLFQIGTGMQLLPTHSDVLDLVAHGGLLALALWAIGLVRAGRIAYRDVLHARYLRDRWAPYGHTLALMSIAGVVVYTFNPILLQPGKAFLVWSNLGLLLGLSLRMREDGESIATRSAK